MALTPQQLSDLNARIGWLLDKHLAPIFKPGVQLTFIARTPGNDNADVLVTTERDLNDVVALALRSLGRAAVGEGVDAVPRANGVTVPPAPQYPTVKIEDCELIEFDADQPDGEFYLVPVGVDVPVPPSSGPFTLEQMVAFLCGEAPLDGVWFGELHPGQKGAFWWRKFLRAAAPKDGAGGPLAPSTYTPSREVVQQALELVDRIRESHAHWGGWSGIPSNCERITNMLRYGSSAGVEACVQCCDGEVPIGQTCRRCGSLAGHSVLLPAPKDGVNPSHGSRDAG